LKPTYHWGDITKNIDRFDDTFLNNVLSKHSSGIEVLCAPNVLNGYPSLTPDIAAQLFDMLRGMFDFVVVDGGTSLNENVLSAISLSQDVFLLATLNLPCLSNAKRIIESFTNLGLETDDRLKVVITRYMKKATISLSDAEEGIGKSVFWTIPNDYLTSMSAINQGKELSVLSRKSQISKSIHDLAATVIDGEKKQKKKPWMFLKRTLRKMKSVGSSEITAPEHFEQRANLMKKTIHELRKLAGHKQIMKGMTKEKYIQIILGSG
jgi:pilus assembly protein CpaE